MTTNTQHQSATILKFPLGGRASRNATDRTNVLPMPASSKRAANVSWDAWYHQDALDDTQPKSKQ